MALPKPLSMDGFRDRNSKYLPVWVILAMALAVTLVTCQIAPKQAASDPGKNAPAKTAPKKDAADKGAVQNAAPEAPKPAGG